MELKIFFVMSVAMTTVTSQVQNVRVPPGALVEIEFEFINRKPGQSGGAGGAGGQASGGMAQGMSPMAQGQMMPQMMGGAMQMMSGGAQMIGGSGRGLGGAGQGMGGTGQMMGGAGQMMGGASQMMGGAGQGAGGAGQMVGGAGQGMGGAGQGMSGAGQSMGGAGQGIGGAGGQVMAAMASMAPGSPIQTLLSNMARMAMALRQMYGINRPLPPMEEPCPCDVECCSRPTEPRRILPLLHLPMTLHRGCCGCVECPVSLSPVISGMVQVARMAASRRPPADA